MALFVITCDFSEGKIEKAYDKRIEYILKQIEEIAKDEKNPEVEGKEDKNEEIIVEEHKDLVIEEIKGNDTSLIKKIKKDFMD